MRRILMVIEDFNELLYLQTILKKVGFDVEGVNQAKKFDDILLAFNPQVILITPKVGKLSAVDILGQIGKVNSYPKIGLLHNAKAHIDETSFKGAGIDFFVNTPVNIHNLVEQIAQELSLPPESLLDKLRKLDSRRADPEERESSHHKGMGAGQAEHRVRRDLPTEESMEILVTDEELEEEAEVIKRDSSVAQKEETVEAKQTTPTPRIEVPNSHRESSVTEEQAILRKQRYQEFLDTMESVEDSHFERDRILEFNKWIRSQPTAPNIEEIESDRKEFVKHLFKFKK